MKKRLPVSVLIPTMNRPESLQKTLMGYLDNEYIPNQIVIVDQSNSEFSDKVKSVLHSFPEEQDVLTYIYQSEPSSTKARNVALHAANNEIIAFSDDDIDVYADTLVNIVELMKRRELALIGGIDDNTPASSSKIGYLAGTKSYSKRAIGHVTLSMVSRYPDTVIDEVETQWAMGYFFVLRKSLVEKWGLLWDERLTGYAYAEDLDFSYGYYKMALSEHLKCVLNNKVRVKHCASREYRIPSREVTFKYVINRLYLSYKHEMVFASRVAMLWCNFCTLIQRCINREAPKDLWDAILFSIRKRHDIKRGIFPTFN